ncbi:Sialin [Orchesella cincta]|uniref:Sialin n=1 Tax=Orchesella cincta TaxID=48709 RepID=A0A1D2M8V7_ORCCI|nr:Sialin [Orchesella cincta]
MKSDPEKGSMKPAPLLFSCRLTLFIVCMFASFNFLLQRMNISFALVCMVKRPNSTSLSELEASLDFNSSSSFFSDSFDLPNLTIRSDEDLFLNDSHAMSSMVSSSIVDDEDDAVCRRMAASRSNSSKSRFIDDGEFEWSKDVQGAILGSFFYGYLFTQIFGGWLAERFGAKKAFLGSIASLSFLTLLNPIAARYGPEMLFAVRLLQGLTHGAALPSMNVFSARWCAPTERGMLMGIAFGGFGFAAAFTFPICAFLCENFGWESIFYATGAFGLLLLVVSYFLIYEWPENHPRISAQELEYLRKTRAVSYSSSQKSKKIQVPWKKIITSGPINVIHITHTCFTWGFLMVGMYMPTYLKEVLYMDTSQNGLYSSLPYMGMLSIHFTVGTIFDFFRRKNCCSVSTLRKVFNTVGMVGPAISMILTGFLSCTNIEFGIAMVTIGQAFGEFSFMGGYMLSIFELAPKYAGIIIGITNTFGVLPGFLCPLFVSLFTPNGTREEWILVFGIAAGMNLLGALLYAIFGSCELQSWAANTERRASSISGPINGGARRNSQLQQNGMLKEQEMLPLTNENRKDQPDG